MSVKLMTAKNPLVKARMCTGSWTPTSSFASVDDVPAKTVIVWHVDRVASGRVAFVVPCLPAALNLEDLPSS